MNANLDIKLDDIQRALTPLKWSPWEGNVPGVVIADGALESESMHIRFQIEKIDEGSWNLYVNNPASEPLDRDYFRVDGLPDEDAAMNAAEVFRAELIARELNILPEPEAKYTVAPDRSMFGREEQELFDQAQNTWGVAASQYAGDASRAASSFQGALESSSGRPYAISDAQRQLKHIDGALAELEALNRGLIQRSVMSRFPMKDPTEQRLLTKAIRESVQWDVPAVSELRESIAVAVHAQAAQAEEGRADPEGVSDASTSRTFVDEGMTP